MALPFGIIARGVASASGNTLARAAAAIGRLMSTKVSAEGIMEAMRHWAANNPTKFLIAVNTLAAAGIDIAIEELGEFFGDGDTRHVMLLDEIRGKVTAERQLHVGDGDPDTVHGLSVKDNDRLTIIEEVRGRNSIIARAVTAIGSIDALEAIRTAIFLEDEDFVLYRKGAV